MIPNTWPSVERMEQEAKAARRERIALEILIAMLNSQQWRGAVEIAALQMADSFIEELDKEPVEGRRLE